MYHRICKISSTEVNFRLPENVGRCFDFAIRECSRQKQTIVVDLVNRKRKGLILVKTICQNAMYAILYAKMLYVNIFYLSLTSANAPIYPNRTQMYTAEATHSTADVISRIRARASQPVRFRVCHTQAASVEYRCFDFTVSMCV